MEFAGLVKGSGRYDQDEMCTRVWLSKRGARRTIHLTGDLCNTCDAQTHFSKMKPWLMHLFTYILYLLQNLSCLLYVYRNGWKVYSGGKEVPQFIPPAPMLAPSVLVKGTTRRANQRPMISKYSIAILGWRRQAQLTNRQRDRKRSSASYALASSE